jgi:putative CocE/NonD family hydrolase
LIPEGADTARTVKDVEEERRKVRAYHGKVDEERRDILVYDTAPLTDSLTIVGPISAVVYAASSAKDTDWFVRLSEVAQDGEVFQLVEGKIRARFRESVRDPKPLAPGEIIAYDLDLWHTGITVPPGSKLRAEVASASFPMFSRNLNTGGRNEREKKFVAAEQTIYHDPEHPSHVLLPVIPGR